MQVSARARITGAVSAAAIAVTLGSQSFGAVAEGRAGLASQPVTGGAQVLDGVVWSADQVGDRIILGGNFTQIKLPNGKVVDQPYLAAMNARTGAFIDDFRPKVNKEVWAVQRGRDTREVFIGGVFTTVNGKSHKKLARLDPTTGAPHTWTADAGVNVKTLALTGNRLFVGGTFASVNGEPHQHLAEVSAGTGRVNSAFTMDVTGSRASGVRRDGRNVGGSGPLVRSVRVTPDGKRLLVVHRATEIGGQTRLGAAFIDISGPKPVVTSWRTHIWDLTKAVPHDPITVQEAEISPDGKYFVITNDEGNDPPLHDTAIAFNTTGGDGVMPRWVEQNFDSAYGVAITNTAVYIGGHFCWIESNKSKPDPMYWPGPADNNLSCWADSAASLAPKTIKRYHMAALDPKTGHPLENWNVPSNNSRNGVRFLRITSAGLLVGHDGTKLGGTVVGRFGIIPPK